MNKLWQHYDYNEIRISVIRKNGTWQCRINKRGQPIEGDAIKVLVFSEINKESVVTKCKEWVDNNYKPKPPNSRKPL